jgi:uncharacterized membrane-anchored protein YjiN (DUF445 family)
MDLRVNDDAMKSLVAKAIMDSLTQENREKLITDAITQTLTKPEGGNSYAPKRSPLQQAFDNAVETEARKYAAQVVSEDETFKARIRQLFADVADKLFSDAMRGEIVDGIAGTVSRALNKDRY